jgi:protein involved in temperature-dependent protein secretion
LQLSRKTEWETLAADQYAGLGQRVLTTSSVELGLLEAREIVLDAPPPDDEHEAQPPGDSEQLGQSG